MKGNWKECGKKLLAGALCAVMLAGGIASSAPEARAVEPESVVTRDDGVWLFPLDKERYNHFSDWAGCHGMQDCPFHGYYCGHGDSAHGDDKGNFGGHQGFDVGAAAGSAVMAAASGIYYAAPPDAARGNYVVIEHPLGNGWSYYSCYQHLSAFGGQSNGAWVNAGDKIGEVGSSGYSFGAHLHFGLTLGASGEGVNGTRNERSGDAVSEMWVRTPGLQRGRIVANPSVNSPAGVPTGDYDSIALHAGSVRYTFDKNSVSIGESASSNAEIKEGSYRIRNGSVYLSADNDSDGGDIAAKAASQADNQLFEAIKGNGSYTFRAKNSASGRMLNVYTADASRDGNKITLWQPTGHATQAWILEQVDGNNYKLHPSDNAALALTLEDSRVVLRSSKSGDSSQIWTLEGGVAGIAAVIGAGAQQIAEASKSHIAEGSYRIRNGSVYLSADNDSDGGDIAAKAATKSDSQLFEAIRGDNSYTFRAKSSASGRMLNVYTADASRDGNKITLWQPTGHATQAWKLERVDGNNYKLHPSDNAALALTLEDSRVVLRSSKSGDASQIWTFESGDNSIADAIIGAGSAIAQQIAEASKSYLAEGAYRIHNGVGYLSARDDSDGGDITLMNATKTKSQAFYAVKGDGSYTFRSANSASGRMLNVYTADASRDGNKITLWQPTGHATQAWKLERVDSNRYVLHPSDNASLALTMELKDAAQNIYVPVLRTYKSGDKSQIWTFDKDFKDANENAYYYQPLQWASVLNILGSDSDTFSPNANCPRAQMVYFMWRAAGSPEPKSASNPFTDVKSGDSYYKAVLWAVENGITKGTTATTFSPNATVTRGQAVTLMYRFAKVLKKISSSSSSTASGGYSDVKSTSFCYDAVNWASAAGITKGTTATTFSPSTLCSRSHIVTFLYRFLGQ